MMLLRWPTELHGFKRWCASNCLSNFLKVVLKILFFFFLIFVFFPNDVFSLFLFLSSKACANLMNPGEGAEFPTQ